MPKLEPPTFLSETKSFETYRKDLERWALLTDVKPKLQTLLMVNYLDDGASGVKKEINARMDKEDLKKKGVKNLLVFLATVCKADSFV